MKRLLIIALICAYTNARALDCNGHLILEGDSSFKVHDNCGAPNSVHMGSINTDAQNWTYVQGNTIHTVKFINDEVRSVTSEYK